MDLEARRRVLIGLYLWILNPPPLRVSEIPLPKEENHAILGITEIIIIIRRRRLRL